MSGRNYLTAAMFLGALITLPHLVTSALQHVLTDVIISAIFAAAFNLASGMGGMLSFGHAAYLAFGAFATLHLMKLTEAGLQFPTPLLPVAGGLSGLAVGLIVGYFATLRTGVYFAMITLAFSELFHQLAPNLPSLFGGETGLSSFRMPFAGLAFARDTDVYYLALGWGIVVFLLMWLYRQTPFGRLTLAIRDNEQRVRFLGFDAHVTKILIFGISAMFCGVAGGLLAVSNESANYELFGLSHSANAILFTFIGGAGLFLGPPIGAAILRLTGFLIANETRLWPLYEGVIFVLVMMFAPAGIGGLLSRNFVMVRQMRATQAVVFDAPRLMSGLLLAVAFIFLCEAGSAFISREYVAARRVAGGQMIPARFLAASWDPLSLTTWSVPVGLAAAGLILQLATVRRRPATA